MNFTSMRIVTAVLAFSLSSCISAEHAETTSSANEPPMAEARGEPAPDSSAGGVSAIEDNKSSGAESMRTVVVYLTADVSIGFIPDLAGRTVEVSLPLQQSRSSATGRLITDGIEIYVVGNSCSSLHTRYPQLLSCEVTETVSNSRGPVATRASSDEEGFISFSVSRDAQYRLDLQSWPTLEDSTCYWGGSVELPEQVTSLEMPIHVFCQ